MKTNTLLLFIIILLASPLGAQDSLETEEPEFIIPSFLLEVEEEAPMIVTVPLPGEDPLALPPLEIPLPSPGDLQLSLLDTTLALPMEISVLPEVDQAPRQEFFSEGRMGVGLSNKVEGDLSLFYIGSDGSFSLDFLHRGTDGFGGASSGEGFHRRDDSLTGDLTLPINDTGSVDVNGGFEERALGMQDTGSSYELLVRSYDLSVDSILSLCEAGSLILNGESYYLNRWFTGGGDQYGVVVSPELAYLHRLGVVTLGIDGSYRYGSFSDTNDLSGGSHLIRGLIQFDSVLPGGWALESEGGILWDSLSGLDFPIDIALSGPVGLKTTIKVEGGREIEEYPPLDSLKNYPLLSLTDGDEIMTPAERWFGNIELNYKHSDALSVHGLVTYSWWENLLQPGSLLSTGDREISLEDKQILTFNLSTGWLISSRAYLSAGWMGQPFLESNILLPLHEFTMGISIGDQADVNGVESLPWGADLVIGWDYYLSDSPMTTQLPKVDFGGYYKVAPGIKAAAELNNLLAPFNSGGTFFWDDYVDEGLSLALYIEIAL